MSKSVAVLVSCYNHEKFIEQCIESVKAQTYSDWYLFFTDNSSTDRSLEIAESFTDARISINCLSTFFHYSVVPIGIARWMSVMKHQMSADYIAILDADDYWHPEKLEKQMALFEKDPKVKLVFSDCHYDHFDWELKPTDHWAVYTEGKRYGKIQKETFHDKYPPKMDDPYFNLLTCYNFMPCPTLVFEKKALMEVIGNPTHYTSAEDYFFILKMTAKYKCTYVPEPLAYYRVHNEQLTQKTPARCTVEEIDVVKRAMNFRPLSRRRRLRVYSHLLKLYMKLFYKEVKDVSLGF